MKKEQFQAIFKASFSDPAKWYSWFFDAVACNEDDIMIGYDAAGNAVSALLMQRYDFQYQGAVVPMAFISCVATLPQARSKGAASRLLCEALNEARNRGMALCALIPAHPWLSFFYRRFGFADIFYVDRCNYTALHSFGPVKRRLVEPCSSLLSELELSLGCGVVHTRLQYEQIINDMAIDGNCDVLAVGGEDFDGDKPGGGILFAATRADCVHVRSLVAADDEAAQSLLAELRRRHPDSAFVVDGPPVSGNRAFLQPYGMGRVCCASVLFDALARHHPGLKMSIRLSDGLLARNSGVYIIEGGTCERRDSFDGKVDLDVSADTLTSVLFGSESTGDIFGLPTRRAYMSLMLDS